jgi:hypothetical protein
MYPDDSAISETKSLASVDCEFYRSTISFFTGGWVCEEL